MTQTLLPNWLPAGEVARRLSVSPQLVRRWLAAGRLAYVSTPLGRLIDPASVERLAAERASRRR